MLDSVGSSAIRSMGVDIANLTSRLAVQIAIIEEIIDMASTIDQNTWVHNQLTTRLAMSDRRVRHDDPWLRDRQAAGITRLRRVVAVVSVPSGVERIPDPVEQTMESRDGVYRDCPWMG